MKDNIKEAAKTWQNFLRTRREQVVEPILAKILANIKANPTCATSEQKNYGLTHTERYQHKNNIEAEQRLVIKTIEYLKAKIKTADVTVSDSNSNVIDNIYIQAIEDILLAINIQEGPEFIEQKKAILQQQKLALEQYSNILSINIRMIINDRSFKFIHLASHAGDAAVLQLLLDNGDSIDNDHNEIKSQLLHFAAEMGHLKMVNFIIKNNSATVTARNESYSSALHYAAENGHTELVSLLSALKPELLNSKSQYGSTLLHSASFKGHTETVSLLLKLANESINTKNKDGNTPLHLAVAKGWLEIVKLILGFSAKAINLQDNEGNTPLHEAAANGYAKIFTLLIDQSAKSIDLSNYQGKTPLHLAAANGHLEIVKLITAVNFNSIYAQDINRNSILHLAVREKREEVVKLILKLKPELVNMQNSRGNIPLHEAVLNGHTTIFGLLFEKNFQSASHQNKEGDAPLHIAVNIARGDIIQLLLEKAPESANIPNKDGNIPVCYALNLFNPKIAELLLSKLSLEQASSLDLNKTLVKSIQKNCLGVTKILLKLGANKDNLYKSQIDNEVAQLLKIDEQIILEYTQDRNIKMLSNVKGSFAFVGKLYNIWQELGYETPKKITADLLDFTLVRNNNIVKNKKLLEQGDSASNETIIEEIYFDPKKIDKVLTDLTAKIVFWAFLKSKIKLCYINEEIPDIYADFYKQDGFSYVLQDKFIKQYMLFNTHNSDSGVITGKCINSQETIFLNKWWQNPVNFFKHNLVCKMITVAREWILLDLNDEKSKEENNEQPLTLVEQKYYLHLADLSNEVLEHILSFIDITEMKIFTHKDESHQKKNTANQQKDEFLSTIEFDNEQGFTMKITREPLKLRKYVEHVCLDLCIDQYHHITTNDAEAIPANLLGNLT